jgi:hypothetical protein
MESEKDVAQNRIEMNPHLEPHGHHAVEWSYHFPMNGVDAVEASLTIVVPGEKAPSSARESLLNSIIAHTRFSLANASRSAVELSKTFYDDSLWIKSQLCRSGSDFCGISDLENSPVLLRCMRDDFSMGFLSKLTLILQSHLKRSSRCVVRSLRNLEHLGRNQEVVAESLACLTNFDEALRSAQYVIDATLIWRYLRELVRVHPQRTAFSAHCHLEKLCAELEEISELLLVLMGKHIADCQDAFFRVLDRTPAIENYNGCIDFALSQLDKLAQWAKEIHFWRSQMGLVNLNNLVNDHELAARFFERSLELKRVHYRKWDLSVFLHPVDRQIDFWIGGLAAAISALFAFVATVLVAFAIPSANSLSLTQTGLVAISFFAAANTVIYVIKDRMKELLKVYVRRHLRFKGGKLEGVCRFEHPDFQSSKDLSNKESFSVLKLERRTAWEKRGREWHLHLSEIFRPVRLEKSVPTNAVKQLWRIPFDEILDTLDDAVHVLKLPAVDSRPQHLKTYKRMTFPFEIETRTVNFEGKKRRVLETSSLRGHIVVFGAQIVSVELARGE